MVGVVQNGGAFSCELSCGQEAVEFLEDNILYDEEGGNLQEEADVGHEFDDEEGEAAQENIQQSHVHASSFQKYGSW